MSAFDTPDSAFDAYDKACEEGFTKELQLKACELAYVAYLFARNVKGADVECCQIRACVDPWLAFEFAMNVEGADIEYCKQHMGYHLDEYLEHQMRDALK